MSTETDAIQAHPGRGTDVDTRPVLHPDRTTHDTTVQRTAGAVTAVVDGRAFTLPLPDAWLLSCLLESAVLGTLEARRPVDDAERLPYTGACPPFCHGRHHESTAAIDDYHHRPLGDVGVNHDPLSYVDELPPDSVSVQLLQHVTRDGRAYVAVDDQAQALRFTPDQARALAAKLLQGATIIDELEAHHVA